MGAVHFLKTVRGATRTAQWLNITILLLGQIVSFDIELERAAECDIEHLKAFANSQIWHRANLRLANGHVKSSSMLSVDVSNGLHEELETLALRNKARAIGVALHDLETGFRFSLCGDRWFHAASTIKVAVLLAVFRAADEGRLRLDDSLHVRNRFFSAADGSLFHLNRDSDAMPELYESIGRTAEISVLAQEMIAASSNPS